MKVFRLAASLLLLAAMLVGVSRVSASSSPDMVVVPCDALALSAPFTGSMRFDSFDNFGCQGTWAFVWATVGLAPHEIGVTEVLRFDEAVGRWRIISRLTYCKPHLLPSVVYRQGCFSN